MVEGADRIEWSGPTWLLDEFDCLTGEQARRRPIESG